MDLITAYGFTGGKPSLRVVRRSDGKIVDKHVLASTNFEMGIARERLSVQMYSTFGRANFRLEAFDGAAPHLVALATTAPDPREKPKPYDPPLTHVSSSLPGGRVGF